MSTRAQLDCAGPGRWTACILALVVALPGLARAEADAAPLPTGCGPSPTVVGVAAVVDARTVTLADGRALRLAGIEVPAADLGAAHAEAHADAKAYLESLVAGRAVTLGHVEHDRYGRLVAHAFAAGMEPAREPRRWIQGELVARGHARVAGRRDSPACTAALRQRERAARAAQLGLWADPYYGLRRADDPAAVAHERGRFAIVEGRVVSVRESGGTLYVNFGGRWSTDFTVTIAKRQERTFAQAGLEPKRLAGRRIQVRGFIEERGGPWIEATVPEQIEVVERN